MAKDKKGKKEKKHKDDSEEKKKRKREEKAARAEDGQQPGVDGTPHSHKKRKDGHKDGDAGAATPTAAAADASAKKKKKHKAAAADGSAGQQQQQRQTQQQQQQQPGAMPAAPSFDPLRDGDRTLAAFRAMRAPGGPEQLRPCWPLEGAAPAAKRPLAPMERVLAGKAELWVIQLPGQMDAEALDGCVLQLDEAMAGSAERAGEMGSLEIAADAAEDLELVRRYTLRQEGAAAKDELFVAAPTEHSAGALEVLRPARRLVVAEDVAAANEALVARAHGGTPELQFYPHAMPAERANRLLQKEHIFKPPPAEPPKGTWPPPGWQPDAALQERDKRRAARRRKGLPEVDPRDDLEQQPLTDLRPAPGAPWGEAGGRPLPPQWQALPGGGGGGGALLGDVEQDVSVSYRYA